MNLLVLSPFLPFPEDNGMKIVLARLLHCLEKEKVYFLAFKETEEKIPHDDLAKVCAEYYIFPRPVITRWDIFKNYFSLKPLLASRFFSPEAARKVSNVISEKKIDVVLFESLQMAPYLDYVMNRMTILHALNIEHIRAKRRVKNVHNLWKKIYFSLIAFRLEKYEKRVFRRFDYLWACSEHDRGILEKITGCRNISVLPNIIDPDYFRPLSLDYDPHELLFLGTLWYQPNEEAAFYLIDKIFPLLKEAFPQIKLRIIGEGASPRLSNRAQKWSGAVKIMGKVEDIRPYLARAGAMIAPILSGSGTRIKILTAMAMGVPVISTKIGCEGLEVEDSREVLIAESPAEFREKLRQLLTNRQLRECLSKNSRALVETKYSPSSFKQKAQGFFQQIENEISLLKRSSN